MHDNNCNGCNHQHDCEDMDNIIELTGENGDTLKVEFLASVKVDEQEYAIMQTLDDDEDEEGEIVIMRMEYDDEEDEYYLVGEEDEAVQERVFEAFQKAAMEESGQDE